MLGEGLVQGNPVWSSHKSRRQPSTGMIVSSVFQPFSTTNMRASSPTVIPWRKGKA